MGSARERQRERLARIRETRLDLVAQLYRRGYSIRQICTEAAKQLGQKSLSTATVHKDVKALLQEWRDERREVIDEALTIELERIDEAVRELWQVWERSKQMDAIASPAIIAEIRKQLEERRKLLGLYAPEKQEVKAEGFPEIRIEVVNANTPND